MSSSYRTVPMGQRAAAARHLFSARGPLIGERSLRLVTLAAAPAVAALAAACAPTVNLSDPGGPKFEGSFAPAASAVPDAGTPAPLRVVTFNVKLGRAI